MTKRQIATVLRKARDLMNNDGTHWMQGKLRRKSPKKGVGYQFCMLGSIFEVLGESHRTYTLTDQSRPVVYALARSILGRLPVDDGEATRTVYTFNDNLLRTWEQVSALMTSAATNPVWR